MYYLQSRYYNPEWGRFINADALVSTGQGILGNNMFAYCNNNPVRYADPTGEILIEVTLSTVGTVLCIAVCGIAIIYFGGKLLMDFFSWLSTQWYAPFATVSYVEEEQIPDITYPGDDPEKVPEGYEWKGKGTQGSKEGNYHNKDSGESLHPDLEHPDPIGPHWDYNYRGSGCAGWRIYPNGSVVPKMVGWLIAEVFMRWEE